jgi:hypothetical protein
MTADLIHDPAVVALRMSLLRALRSVFRTRAELALENLALRQQLRALSPALRPGPAGPFSSPERCLHGRTTGSRRAPADRLANDRLN